MIKVFDIGIKKVYLLATPLWQALLVGNLYRNLLVWKVGFFNRDFMGKLIVFGNVASLSLLYRYYFSRCSFEPNEFTPFPHTHGRSTHYSNMLHVFSVTITDIQRCHSHFVFWLKISLLSLVTLGGAINFGN